MATPRSLSLTLSPSWTPSSSSAPTLEAASSAAPPAPSDAPTSACGLLSTIHLPSTHYSSLSPYSHSSPVPSLLPPPPQLTSSLISSSYFTSKDGWYNEEDDGGRPTSSAPSPSRRMFDSYRSSICPIQCKYASQIPGCAFKNSLPYIELKDSQLIKLASLQVQRQFYQTAVFLGCTSGEIEFGITASSNANMHMNAQRVFAEEFIQQSALLGDQEFVVHPPLDQNRPSSSSSSLRSLSVSSPEYSSVLLPPMAPETSAAAFGLPHAKQAYARHRSATPPFPSSARDDAAMTRAMLAVISSTSQAADRAQRSAVEAGAGRLVGAFRPYNRAFAPRSEAAAPILRGQKMIKMVINHLRVINLMRSESRTARPEVRPTSNQLHHMISERKRREKLNESFDALRMLLPPATVLGRKRRQHRTYGVGRAVNWFSEKKDKASVLAHTRNYLTTLKSQVSELEERNRLLEEQLHQHQDHDRISKQEDDDSKDRIQIQITRPSQSSSTSDEVQAIHLTITMRAAEQCNMIHLILTVLERLKKLQEDITSLLSVEATTRSPQSNSVCMKARFKLQVKGGFCDEESLKKAVREAVDAAVAASTVQHRRRPQNE
ncbi:transcription factor bHLH041 [Canna indica]|uniref:Transcription factor bHLH041 n=1 Tax=Canna indica TaxID=4628 RepID=A0AAQ3Q3G4_9LILI|nr:transcription factor bHLH041 [Canna indica]